jgi:tRNA dimethylallyltransferase
VNNAKTVIIIVGPTASGKTDLSLQLASHFNTSIISADSRQCYRELNIGVAKPGEEALNSIRHYFINSHSIHETVNAQVFEEYALQAVREIFINNDVAVMVGGTGMYIKAFCEGLDEIPMIDPLIRDAVIKNYKEKGLSWLQNEVKKKDPAFWVHAEQKNPRRLMRALEIVNTTERSILSFRKNKKKERLFQILQTGIELTKDQLYENINNRTDKMIKEGLIEEVKALLPYKNINALQTVGYKEIFNYFEGSISLQQATELIKTRTRQYAKRQLTWFKKETGIQWFDFNTAAKTEIINYIKQHPEIKLTSVSFDP